MWGFTGQGKYQVLLWSALPVTKKGILGQKSLGRTWDFLIWGDRCQGRLGKEVCPCQDIHMDNREGME